MGPCHLMGPGRSPGAVIGPLSYLAHRYLRFFTCSGAPYRLERGASQSLYRSLDTGKG